MGNDKIYSIDGGNKPNITKDQLKEMRERLPFMVEYLQIIAEMTRAKYEALIAQGFTKDEALKYIK